MSLQYMYIKDSLKILFKKLYYLLRYKVLKFIVDQIATPRLADTGSRRLSDSPIRGVVDSPTLRYGIDSWAP
jgi:hypothetical protein